VIAVVADPLSWDRWPQAEAFLEPARARGDFESVIEPDEELFAVLGPSGELLGAATAWFDIERRFVEVKLVGGREFRRWIGELNDELGRLARLAGAERMVAIGRRGWGKILPRLGWVKLSGTGDETVYSRELSGGQ
jgi:hypothetical protein